jgi:P-type Ca2+ transporter type 2C
VSTRTSTGLTCQEAAQALMEHGPNSLPDAPSRGVAARVLEQLRDPMILLLLAAGAVTAAVGDVTDTAVIAVVIILNTTIGVVQELRAERAITALRRMAAPAAKVRRDGAVTSIATAELVPGDSVLLDAGDIVPADGTLYEVHQLQLDESAMTGESLPVEKAVADELQSGTVVTRGRAELVVTRTGADSGLGRVAELIAATPTRATPLQQRLTRLSKALVLGVLVLAACVLGLGLAQGEDPVRMLVVAVSLAVAAVPESLPAVVSVALALGAHRMAKRSAIVRRLPAVETLGSVTVIASDKTGTLTQNRMVAERVVTPAGRYTALGVGYAPEGDIMTTNGGSVDKGAPDLQRLLRAAVLCNDARLVPATDDQDWTALGDPLEAAMLALAERGGQDTQQLRAQWRRVAERPFDSQRMRMTTLSVNDTGEWLVTSKGAPEVMLRGLTDDEATLAAARSSAQQLASDGYRVIAVADRECEEHPVDLEDGLRLAGLVAVADPPRDTAREVVAACRAAGIRLVLITGDHPATAGAIAERLGIREGFATVVEGREIDEGRLDAGIGDVGVFARTRPEQKVAVIEALHREGHVVAMTGDGVNDAPALRRADIGVAMGRGGTEVARQAAELVLADDDLRSVVAAVEEGRRIFANIRAFLGYALSGGLAEIVVMLAGPFLGLGIPLLPAQILWINMLTHGLPGVAFGGEPLDPEVMHQPSRPPRESVLGGGLAGRVGMIGSLIAVVSLVAGLWIAALDGPVQSAVFVTLGLAQLGVALALRAPVAHRTIRQRGVETAVALAVVLQLAGLYLSPLQGLLGTEPLAPATLVVLVLLALVPGVVVSGARRVRRTAGVEAAA